MFILDVLTDEARRSFYDALLESLKIEAESPKSHIFDTEKVFLEQMVRIDKVTVLAEKHLCWDGDSYMSYDYKIEGVTAEDLPTHFVVTTLEF